MKNIWKKMVVVIALVGASSLLSARGAVSVYAEGTATAEASAGTNAPSTTTRGTSADADHPPVRIDETGVHVGGPNPVDINAPDFVRRHGEWGILAAHMTGMLAIVCTFGMPVAIIALAGYFAHRRNRMAHETMRAMIEKGVPITPELVAEIRNKRPSDTTGGSTRGRLLPGLVLAGIGTALLISGSGGDRKGGWIVLFIGAAFLITWFVEHKSQNKSQPPR